MIEKLIRFGPNGSLTGILSLPEQKTSNIIVLISNAGAVHKPGPFRLHVDLAKKLTSMGMSAFRFDLSGQGDSQKRINDHSRQEMIAQDMKWAVDELVNLEPSYDIVALGLCTGADNAHKAAVHDRRIKAVVWLDGYGYLTPTYRRNKLKLKLANPLNIILKLFNVFRFNTQSTPNKSASQAVSGVDDFIWKLPPKSQYIEEMRTLNDNGTQCLYIYSGGVQSYYNYQGQMHDAFRGETFLECIEEIYFPESTHTFFVKKDREEMMEVLTNWLENLDQGSNA